jgi:hypothetical protein
MFLEVVNSGWEVDVLDEDGPLIGVVTRGHRTTLRTTSLILIYRYVIATIDLLTFLMILAQFTILRISLVVMVIAVCRHSYFYRIILQFLDTI